MGKSKIAYEMKVEIVRDYLNGKVGYTESVRRANNSYSSFRHWIVNENCRPAKEGGVKVTKEELGTLILNSERQLYSTAKTILINDQDCADAIQETIV